MPEPTTNPVHAMEIARYSAVDSWTWQEPHRGEHFRRCSWCGSMHPDDLAAETTARIEWADWKYGWPHKFYVHVPNQDPEALFCVGTSPADQHGCINGRDLTDEQREVIQRDGWGGIENDRSYLFSTRPTHFGKFYTVHLADPDLEHATREAITERCGLRITFEDGRVSWAPVP